MLAAIFMSILSLHFLRILAGNVYRAAVAFRADDAQLQSMLGKEALSRFERPKLFLHVLLSS